MKLKKETHLDFEIDKLTNSIENSISGEVFDTIIVPVLVEDSKDIKKADWVFDWRSELRNKGSRIYKLTTINNPFIIHGLIAITDKKDHVFLDLIESSKFNKGKSKVYLGVAGNLVAFACKAAFELNYNGVVSFIAKTQLIAHYQQTLGAKLFSGNRMYIDTKESLILVKKYFKGFKYDKL